jgi:predicted PurR-regulated permease PerM
VDQKRSLNIHLIHVILTLVLVGLIFSGFYLGADIIIPALLGLLFAILLRPIVAYIEKHWRLPHTFAAFFSVSVFIVFIALIVFFISREVVSFTEDLPMIKKNVNQHAHSVQQWIKNKFNISYSEQNEYLNNAAQETITGNKTFVTSTIGSFTQIVLNISLVPIYTFLILLYKTLFITFLKKKIEEKNHPILMNILYEIKTVVRSYIIGLSIEMAFVAVMTSVGFWIAGVNYFIFLGLMTAILNLIPYIGVLIAGTISLIIALVSSNDLSIIIGVLCVNITVQFIDNNLLVPRIVGSKVSLNALVSIMGVIIGGSLAGIAGMFLAIPYMAMIKIIMDNIPELEPWGYLLGNKYPQPPSISLLKRLKRKFTKTK